MVGLPSREYVIEEYTRTVCPLCFEAGPRRSDDDGTWVDGMLVSRDGSVWLRRYCGRHGETESLYEEDAAIWRARGGWSVPTLRVVPDRADNFVPFPAGYRDGLPASHGQHTCVLVLNVTERCNLSCPTCYADARPPGAPAAHPGQPTIPDLLATVDTVLVREAGKLGVLMLSGGEPTVRDDLPELLHQALERNITRVMLNTNGRRIARDDRLLRFLERHRDRIEVYLQFDGLRPATYLALRGEDLAREKVLALRRPSDAGVFTTLVATVRRGVNEDEVGALARLGLETTRCSGLAIQPQFGSGRAPAFDPRSRATPTGVLRRLEEQTDGMLRSSDFIPLPCSHRDCCDITYLLRGEDGTWRSLPALIGRDELRRWLHLVGNSITFDTLQAPLAEVLRTGALQRVFSEQLKVGTPALAADLARMCDCVPGLGRLMAGLRKRAASLDALAEATFRITVKMFMDAHTFHEARIRQCCVHTGTIEEDPRRFSFCWRWLFADAADRPEGTLISAGSLRLPDERGPHA